jgi:poly(hydroxyalkanoate) depolymerase family esterase
MRGLGKMINQLARNRGQWETLMKISVAAQPSFGRSETDEGGLSEIEDFGANPGNLRMFTYVPDILPPSPALVVVLHGCTQTAAGYDHGSGWSALADRYGFVLVYPEQRDANNPKRCFNWFQTGDIQREQGEAASIRHMVEKAAKDYSTDPRRVFVTGLSAGGAMTSTMLATYPDVFAAGAIIAGLPYKSATTVAEAFEAMFQGRSHSAKEWGDLVRGASAHKGPWPRVSIWHGSADQTVKPMNAGEIVKQWTNVHGLAQAHSRSDTVDGYSRRTWTNGAGEPVIEEYTITGLAHGTPLATGGENGYGVAGPFLLEAGISSSYRIAEFWGLTEKVVSIKKPAAATENAKPGPKATSMPLPDLGAAKQDGAGHKRRNQAKPLDVNSVITKALRAAGLMK